LVVVGRLQQIATDCNNLQQSATPATNDDGSQATKNPVVEHKGSSDEVFGFFRQLIHSGSLRLSDDPGSCLPLWLTPLVGRLILVPKCLRHYLLSRRANMSRRTIRLTQDADERLQSTAKLRGYGNPSAFLRAAIERELSGREDTVIGAEERLAASIEQVRREMFRLGRSQQALFAFVDSLAKILLTCVPEPGGEATEAAVARARRRHVQLLKSAGQAMVGDSKLAMQDLMTCGDG
jgi:Arc/MetJ-type ribon-helix-helix transcriptional regulator